MKTCRDCIRYDVCRAVKLVGILENAHGCKSFKDESREEYTAEQMEQIAFLIASRVAQRLNTGSMLMKPPKGKYIPQRGERYYLVYRPDGKYKIGSLLYNDDGYLDLVIVQNTPVFRTEEDAQEYIHYLTALDKHRFEPDWEDYSQEKWCLYYNWNYKHVDCLCYNAIQDSNSTYFPSREAAKAFIAEAGEDNVRKFMFDIWED